LVGALRALTGRREPRLDSDFGMANQGHDTLLNLDGSPLVTEPPPVGLPFSPMLAMLKRLGIDLTTCRKPPTVVHQLSHRTTEERALSWTFASKIDKVARYAELLSK
jgi:hypothetical protein